jgi:tetratricopeptide (TPR) repeat protein
MSTELTAKPQERFVLEKDERLSRSMLWAIQRDFYQTRGIDAWASGALPYFVTSNPFIANAYARVALAFINECATAPGATAVGPVQIIEIASGSGRFGFYFLKKLTSLARALRSGAAPFRFVMTDLAQSNIDFWRTHEKLQPFIETGLLDFARFDAANPAALELQCSGEILRHANSPLMVIANYVFDSIPQDLFYISDTQLYESLITLSSSQPEPDPLAPAILDQLQIDYRNTIAAPDYYADPEFDALLDQYRERLGNTNISFPCAALRCIRYLSGISDGRMLLLCGDKGYTREESLLGQESPGLVVHGGAFSLTVNLHAIGAYFRKRGGSEFNTSHRSQNLAISAFVEGGPDGYHATEQAFKHVMEECGPNDIFNAVRLAPRCEDVNEFLSLVRLSGWDQDVFLSGFAPLMEPETRLTAEERIEVYRTVRQVWDQYYSFGEGRDLAFHLGVLLVALDYYREAIDFLTISAATYEMAPGTAYNLSLCSYRIGELDEALKLAELALTLDPDFDQAKTLRITILDQADLGSEAKGEIVGAGAF